MDVLEELIFEVDNKEFYNGACGWCIGLRPGEDQPRPYFDLDPPIHCPRCHQFASTLYPWTAIQRRHWWYYGGRIRHTPGRLFV